MGGNATGEMAALNRQLSYHANVGCGLRLRKPAPPHPICVGDIVYHPPPPDLSITPTPAAISACCRLWNVLPACYVNCYPLPLGTFRPKLVSSIPGFRSLLASYLWVWVCSFLGCVARLWLVIIRY